MTKPIQLLPSVGLAGFLVMFAIAWNSDSRSQAAFALRAEKARALQLAAATAPATDVVLAAPETESAPTAARPLFNASATSPLARLAPGAYRMVDGAGRTALLRIEAPATSGSPAGKVLMMDWDGEKVVFVRVETSQIAAEPGPGVR